MNIVILGTLIGLILWLLGIYLNYLAFMISKGWYAGKSHYLAEANWRFVKDKEKKEL